MTKKGAQKILNKYVSSITFTGLPINDVVLVTEASKGKLTQWSFKGLIKIAYDLK